MRTRLTRRSAGRLDRQQTGPKPFSREWTSTPTEQRAVPQRAQIGPPPAWVPSERAISIALVFFLVLLATIFQSNLNPGVDSEFDLSNLTVPDVTATATLPATHPTATVRGSTGTPGLDPTPTVSISTEPLFPDNRIVAYYGHPHDPNLGILGQLNPEELLAQLLDEAAGYERADPDRPVLPAFEIIVSVAQSDPGPDGSYVAQTDEATIREYIEFTQANGILLILDVQVGRTTVADEIALIEKYLVEPNVHLGIDPEFSLGPDQLPGIDIGSIDAVDVNFAQDELARIAEENNLPPKLLIVHRFTDGMVTNSEDIERIDGVQLVIDVDGFGDPIQKEESYSLYARDGNVRYSGIKLFYDQDHPLMSPAEVLELSPAPDFIMYQ